MALRRGLTNREGIWKVNFASSTTGNLKISYRTFQASWFSNQSLIFKINLALIDTVQCLKSRQLKFSKIQTPPLPAHPYQHKLR